MIDGSLYYASLWILLFRVRWRNISGDVCPHMTKRGLPAHLLEQEVRSANLKCNFHLEWRLLRAPMPRSKWARAPFVSPLTSEAGSCRRSFLA